MGNIKLVAKVRAGQVDGPDMIPAVVYGAGEHQILQINKVEFDRVFAQAGESNLIDLEVGGKELKVLVKDLQRHVTKNFISHVDFYQVDMSKKVTTEIPFNFVGESQAVKEGAMLMTNMDAVEVECLPSDLKDHIDIDISALEKMHDSIRLEDITLPQGMEATAEDKSITIVAAVEPKKVEEEPVVETEDNKAEEGAEAEKSEETKEGESNE